MEKRPQDIGPDSKAMGEIVRYLKNYPFLLITVAGLLILVGILIFDKDKLEIFKWLIYGVVLVPIVLQFFLEYKKQNGRRDAGEKAPGKPVPEKLEKPDELPAVTGQPRLSRKAIASLALFALFLLAVGSEQGALQDSNFRAGALVMMGIPGLLLAFLALSDTLHGKAGGKGWAIAALVVSVLMILALLGGGSGPNQATSQTAAPANPSGQQSSGRNVETATNPAPTSPPVAEKTPPQFNPLQGGQPPASRCETQAGWCPMMVAIPVGSGCTCTNAYGVFAGIAR